MLISRISWSIICKVEAIALRSNNNLRFHNRKHALSSIDIPHIKVTPVVSKSGFVHRFTPKDLDSIKAQNFDVLVRCGSGILRGGILDLCKFGILSFHHANNNVNRGGPSGFWEVFNRNRSTGFVIQRLKEELDGGDVFFAGSIATSYLFKVNQAKLHKKANIFLHRVLDKLGESGNLPEILAKKPYAYPLYRMPNLSQQIYYLIARLGPGVANKILQRYVHKKADRWGVAFQFVDDWKSSVLWRSKIIRNPPNRFLADPFVWTEGDRSFCFLEDFDYKSNRGCIACYELASDGYTELGTVLEEPFHLSFPFLFNWNGQLFMCPDTGEIGEIRLYLCKEFPTKWSYHKTLISNVRATDSVIFALHGKWWLLTNVDSSDADDFGSELHIYYADSPDSDDWVAHVGNPVIFNSECARNGGLIIEGESIFRVFQVQGFNSYGESLGVSEIKKLDENSYEEEVMIEIPPKYFPDICGTHSLAFRDGVLAIDFKKYESTVP